MLRRMATVVAATASLALIGAGPALAQDTINLQETHKGSTALGFGTQECDGPFEDLGENEDGWHFIAPGGSSFISLSLTFTDLDDNVVNVLITSTDPANPSTGAGWSGYFTTVGQGVEQHAWVFTEAGWTLEDGTAQVDDKGTQDFFVLSHTCPGVPTTQTPTPTPTPTPTLTPTPTPTPTEDGETPKPVPTEVPAGYGQADNGSAGTMGLIAFATALAIGGAALVSRRFLKDN